MRTGLIVLSLGMLWGGMLHARGPLCVQEQARPLIATVVQVDVLKPAVTVLDTWGKATELYLGRNARVYRSRERVEEFGTIYDLEPGQQVRVSYSGAADSPDSVRITILTRE